MLSLFYFLTLVIWTISQWNSKIFSLLKSTKQHLTMQNNIRDNSYIRFKTNKQTNKTTTTKNLERFPPYLEGRALGRRPFCSSSVSLLYLLHHPSFQGPPGLFTCQWGLSDLVKSLLLLFLPASVEHQMEADLVTTGLHWILTTDAEMRGTLLSHSIPLDYLHFLVFVM